MRAICGLVRTARFHICKNSRILLVMLHKVIAPPSLPWPRVLVVVNRPSTQALAASLRLTRLAASTATTAQAAMMLLGRRKYDLLVVDPVDLPRLAPLPPSVRAVLLASPGTVEGSMGERLRIAIAPIPPEPRRLTAEILLLANGHPAVDTVPEDLDPMVSIIRPLGLLFVGASPVPLRPGDRALAELLTRERDKPLSWDDVMAALGCSRNTAYAAASRIREALVEKVPDHIYIHTVHGEGLFWATPVCAPPPPSAARRPIVPANTGL